MPSLVSTTWTRALRRSVKLAITSLISFNCSAADDEAPYLILKVDCRYDHVNHIVVRILQPGVLELEWDNNKICGHAT